VELAPFLADKSVWARLRHPTVASVMVPLVERGLVGTCAVVDLEVLYSTRNAGEHGDVREERLGLPRFTMPDEVWDRAIEVQGCLADRGQHRAASIPDLLLASTAERHGATVLHYDADFDLIAEVTRQPTQWVVPRGTAS
jgi:predicted nucleic acid-binding protein